MKNILFAFCLISIPATTITSCNKDAIQRSAATRVANISKYNNGNEFIQFEYNTDASVKKVTVKSELSTAGDATDFLVSYNDDKNIKELTANDGKIVPVYTNGLLTRADIIQYNKKIAFTDYTYEGNKLKAITIYYNEEEGNIPVLQFNFSYNNAGNISETVTMMADGAKGKLTYAGSNKMDYSSSINPLYEYNNLLMLLWQPASKNNVATERRYNKNHNASAKNNYYYTFQNNEYSKMEL